MKVAVFDIHSFERPIFQNLNLKFKQDIRYLDTTLNEETVALAKGSEVVCCFTNDRLNAQVLTSLSDQGVKLIALRSAGFNHVDLTEAARLKIKVVRVPAYSPYAIAEHAALMILALDRKICKAVARVRELNFSLDGLLGFDLHDKTVGIIGTGRIGSVMAKIMTGFGCRVLAFDQNQKKESVDDCVRYVPLEQIYKLSDIVTLHLPLTKETKHILNARAFGSMKKGVMIINTGRGALIDTKDLIDGLKSGQIGYAGLDVYEEEESIFSHDLSDGVLQDDVLARLMTFPNVLITAHQGFLTHEAVHNIVETSLQNIQDFQNELPLANEVTIL